MQVKKVINFDENLSKEEIITAVKNNDKIKKHLVGKNIQREIYVPEKIVNLVIK